MRTRPGLSLRELAEAEGISAPSLSGHIDRLETAGLLRRVRSSDDRRRVGLELTPEGRAILKRVRARRTTWLADRLDRLSDDERERVEQALPALRTDAGAGPVRVLSIALRRRTFRSLRRHRNYRLFFSGQIVSVAGTWMQNIALAWLVIELSGVAARRRGARVLPVRAVPRASASSPASSSTGSTRAGSSSRRRARR